ncbi:LapD/MoxY N-terminal periplasmic domain-containing protein [Pseudomonas aeruginosa]|uniref:LapD/MoxY N-terminal periplasmic domain-containing protein n=1 Tax=Pseudomonas aeruginosa TaxID=287 RepID=UPI002E2B16E8|nr:LapD/MoxY N-terminal periplasmic domain-containing protein [Pseudomonas aeruginosa]
MSLLKQLFLAICLFLVVAFSGSFVSSVENSREQLRGQLRSHAQDAATALGLSLTPHVDDPAMVQLMVSSIFDSGYFASIRVIDIKSGKPLVERVQAHAERTVPGWFERLVDLQPQGGDALIMRGWEQAARVEVVSHPQFALARLWDSALGSLYWLLACGAASLLLGGWLLRRQLRPLDQMVRQAHAISRREFLSLPRLPRTPELRRVVQAMNQMVEKLRTLFAEEAARSDKLRAQAYQDSLTGLPNRRLFDARLNEQLGAGEHEHAGQLLLLNAKVYNSPHHAYGTQRLTCYDLESRGTLWGATLSAQVSAFAPLPGGQWIALALVDGQVEVRDLASGECRWRYRTADAIPLCLAVSDKLLAIGFSHGGVSLLQVAADGQLIGPPGANPRQ